MLNINPEIREQSEYNNPLIITHWLPFLPKNFTEISGIYLKPNGQVALFVDSDVYYINYPSLRYASRQSMNTLFGRPVKLNAVLNTNHGKTFAFTDSWMVFEINECTNKAIILGSVANTFPGIPERGLIGAFRYINGRVYFLTDSHVLEFDEYTDSVVTAKADLFEVLGITCMGESLINKLHRVLQYLH